MKAPVREQHSDIGPLSGLRVLDLTRVLAGPICTMILGDLGADVIKVERPGNGDETRTWGPPFDAKERSAYYLSVNRNKLGLALDFGTPADLETCSEELIADADVVVDNFRAGVLERCGSGPDAIIAAHPSSLSGAPSLASVLRVHALAMTLSFRPNAGGWRSPVRLTVNP